MNSPAGATGGDPATAAEFVARLGFTHHARPTSTAAAQSVEESR